MTPFYQFAIGRSLVRDGIDLINDAARQGVFIRASTAADLERTVAGLRDLANRLEQAHGELPPLKVAS